jgi:uncharacterized delta-60 repeat protein
MIFEPFTNTIRRSRILPPLTGRPVVTDHLFVSSQAQRLIALVMLSMACVTFFGPCAQAREEGIAWSNTMIQQEGSNGFAKEIEFFLGGVDANAVGSEPDGETMYIQRDFTVLSSVPEGTYIEFEIFVELACDPGTAHASIELQSGGISEFFRAIRGGEAPINEFVTNCLVVGRTYTLIAIADMASPSITFPKADATATVLLPRLPDLVAQPLTWDVNGNLQLLVTATNTQCNYSATAVLYWASGPQRSDIIEPAILSRIFTVGPSPPNANRFQETVPCNDLNNPPEGATHLLLVADPDDMIPETDEANNIAAIRPPLVVENPIEVITLNEDFGTVGIELRPVFQDVTTADENLLFALVYNSNVGLIQARADNTLNFIILDSQRDQFGSATLTVRAMNSCGFTKEDTFVVRILGVNDPPCPEFAEDPLITAANSGPRLIPLFANFKAGPTNESNQKLVNYSVSNNNNALFRVQPALSTNGTLIFTPATNATGSATVTVITQDDGGTDLGGVDKCTNSFTIRLEHCPGNTMPRATALMPDLIVKEGATNVVINLRSLFADTETPDSELIYWARFNSGDTIVSANVDNLLDTLTLSFQPQQFGNASISIGAIDACGEYAQESFAVTVNPVNDAPVVTLGGDIVVGEDAGAQSRPDFASFSPGPINEGGQALIGYTVNQNNSKLFSSPPAINNAGTLTFTSAADAYGSATVSVVSRDNGGTADGGADSTTNTFNITITPVNDPPVITLATNFVVVPENAGPQSQTNFAVFSPGPLNESTQSLIRYTLINTNNSMFSIQPAINNAGLLTFTPATGFNGTALVTVIAQDDGGTAGGGVDKRTTHFVISVVSPPGSVDDAFSSDVNDSVLSTVVQPDGKIVIGGAFTSVNGKLRNYIARLNADGTLDAAFDPNANKFVYCAALQADGKIIIGGNFSTVSGQPRNCIARLNADGTLDSAFDPNAGGLVYTIAVQANGKIIIGGLFHTMTGQPAKYIVRLSTDGILDGDFSPSANSGVFSTAVQADGKIIICGGYSLARLNGDGTLDHAFNQDANNLVLCAAVQADGKIIIGGRFTTIGGESRNYIARFNSDGMLDAGFDPNLDERVISTAVQADGKIIIGGLFTSVKGEPRSYIARLNSDGSVDAGFDPSADNSILSAGLQADGKIIIGGSFTSVGGKPRNHIARLINDAANQSLTVPSTTHIQWLRGGASPEAQDVTFELSTNLGTNWTLIGAGTRIVGGWELTGLNLPAAGYVRTRARVISGEFNGSAGLVEMVAEFPTATTAIPLLSGLRLGGDGAFQLGFSNSNADIFTALATTNVFLPLSNWTVLGSAVEFSPGQYRFTDNSATNFPRRFYRIRSP